MSIEFSRVEETQIDGSPVLTVSCCWNEQDVLQLIIKKEGPETVIGFRSMSESEDNEEWVFLEPETLEDLMSMAMKKAKEEK